MLMLLMLCIQRVYTSLEKINHTVKKGTKKPQCNTGETFCQANSVVFLGNLHVMAVELTNL